MWPDRNVRSLFKPPFLGGGLVASSQVLFLADIFCVPMMQCLKNDREIRVWGPRQASAEHKDSCICFSVKILIGGVVTKAHQAARR